jgi:hypothetical protein
VTLANPALVLAVVWDMTVKPGTASAAAAVLVAWAVGTVAARPFARTPVPESAPAGEPTG